MYVLSFNIGERAGSFTGDTSDEVLDRLCNKYDHLEFDNKVVDTRYRIKGRKYEFEKYEESSDIVDGDTKVGHYTIKKVDR